MGKVIFFSISMPFRSIPTTIPQPYYKSLKKFRRLNLKFTRFIDDTTSRELDGSRDTVFSIGPINGSRAIDFLLRGFGIALMLYRSAPHDRSINVVGNIQLT